MDDFMTYDELSNRFVSDREVDLLAYATLQKLAAQRGLGGRRTKDDIRRLLKNWYKLHYPDDWERQEHYEPDEELAGDEVEQLDEAAQGGNLGDQPESSHRRRPGRPRKSEAASSGRVGTAQQGAGNRSRPQSPRLRRTSQEQGAHRASYSTPAKAFTPVAHFFNSVADTLAKGAHSVQKKVAAASVNAASYVTENLTPNKRRSPRKAKSRWSLLQPSGSKKHRKTRLLQSFGPLLTVLGISLLTLLAASAAYRFLPGLATPIRATGELVSATSNRFYETGKWVSKQSVETAHNQWQNHIVGPDSPFSKISHLRLGWPLHQNADAPLCNGQLNFTSLETVLDPHNAWQGIRDTLHQVWDGERLHEQKGLGVLLATSSATAPAVATAVEQSLLQGTQCAKHFLRLQGSSLRKGDAEARAQLQKDLATFLAKYPYGIVFVEGFQEAHPGLTSVWINALSEQGSFQYGGVDVKAWKGLYVFTYQVPAELLKPASEKEFTKRVKDHLLAHLQKNNDPEASATAIWNAAGVNLEPIRRRIDVVAPIREGFATLDL